MRFLLCLILFSRRVGVAVKLHQSQSDELFIISFWRCQAADALDLFFPHLFALLQLSSVQESDTFLFCRLRVLRILWSVHFFTQFAQQTEISISNSTFALVADRFVTIKPLFSASLLTINFKFSTKHLYYYLFLTDGVCLLKTCRA